jgi:hypothetical protein
MGKSQPVVSGNNKMLCAAAYAKKGLARPAAKIAPHLQQFISLSAVGWHREIDISYCPDNPFL